MVYALPPLVASVQDSAACSGLNGFRAGAVPDMPQSHAQGVFNGLVSRQRVCQHGLWWSFDAKAQQIAKRGWCWCGLGRMALGDVAQHGRGLA